MNGNSDIRTSAINNTNNSETHTKFEAHRWPIGKLDQHWTTSSDEFGTE